MPGKKRCGIPAWTGTPAQTRKNTATATGTDGKTNRRNTREESRAAALPRGGSLVVNVLQGARPELFLREALLASPAQDLAQTLPRITF
jgi:hypothetical protein